MKTFLTQRSIKLSATLQRLLPVHSPLVSGQSLTFRTEGVGRPHDVTLVPFYREYAERYTVYWNLLNDAH